MGPVIRGAPLVLLLLLVLPPSPGIAAEGTAGTEACANCHEEVVAEFQRTAHARAHGLKAEESCENCHGPGAAHADGGDPALIVRFAELSTAKASEACLSCHKEQHRQFSFKRGAHSLNDVGCVDCHNPHLTTETMLRARGADLCATCHQSIVGQFNQPRSHPLSRGDEACANCHDPHGTKNPGSLKRAGTETCTTCHVDKAGPFLYEHDISIVDGCQACHQVHGTPNRHLLTHSRTINLCYQCHTGAMTPGFHSAPTFLNEKCTACHTAIHGSNTNFAFLEE